MDEIIKKEMGKGDVERILKQDKGISKIVFQLLWKKLEDDFYELQPKEFALKVLALEIMLKNSGVSLAEELEKLMELKGGKRK